MDTSDFSLDAVLAEANQKMHELAPGGEPPVDETIDPRDRRVEVSVKTLTTLFAFSMACASIFMGEMHPRSAMQGLMGLGIMENELNDAMDEARPLIKDAFMK